MRTSLIDIHGIQEKRDLRGAAIDGIEGSGSFPLVSEISLCGDGLQRDAERGLENPIVEQDNIQLSLKRRNAVQELREVGPATWR